MAGYDDTRNKILETLLQRPVGTEIQPENHQDFALSLLDYIRSVELISGSTLIGIAYQDTVPVQSNDANEAYIAGVAQERTVVFQNFRDVNGDPLTVTTEEMEAKLVVLIWNRQYWSKQEISANIVSQAENAYYFYNLTIRKQYASVAAMNADKVSPMGNDGRVIKRGEIVSVRNSSNSDEDAVYSYELDTEGNPSWVLQMKLSVLATRTIDGGSASVKLDTIQNKRDTKANWEANNPVLAEGEIGLVLDDKNSYKVGDGVTKWNDLPLRGYNGNVVSEFGDDFNSVISQGGITNLLKYIVGNDNKIEIGTSNFDVLDNVKMAGFYVLTTNGFPAYHMLVTFDNMLHCFNQWIFGNLVLTNGTITDGAHTDGTFNIICRTYSLRTQNAGSDNVEITARTWTKWRYLQSFFLRDKDGNIGNEEKTFGEGAIENKITVLQNNIIQLVDDLESDFNDKILDVEGDYDYLLLEYQKLIDWIGELNERLNDQKDEINVAKEEALQAISKNEQSAITNFNSQRVTPEMLSESTKQLIEASGGGTITNLADDEDLTSVDDGTGSNVLKFANRSYNTKNFSGQGYVILRKNLQSVKFKIANITINAVGTEAGNISFKIMNKVFNIPFDPASETTVDLIAKKIADTLTNNVPDFDISQSENTVTLTHTVIRTTPDVVFSSNDTGVEAIVLMTEKEEIRNVLTSDMLKQKNTIYEIKYDFDVIDLLFGIATNIKLIGNGGSINFNRNYLWYKNGIIFENLKLINLGNPYNSNGVVPFISKNCIFKNKSFLQDQGYNAISLDIEHYIQSATVNEIVSKRMFCLNDIIESIQANFPKYANCDIRIIFPNTETSAFYIDRPIIISHGFKYDFNNAYVYIIEDYSYDYIFGYAAFGGNINNNVRGLIKNIRIDARKAGENLKTVFDLTNFNSVLEDVSIDLRNTSAFAFLQPFGTPSKSYSDKKRIVRCTVTSDASNSKPRSVFGSGDGCIIEQSNLSGVLIRGRSYTIKECLNDFYYLYNTNVNFITDYWEIGQFRILNSVVNFIGCQMHFQNGVTDTNSLYKGSLFSIDTEEAKNAILSVYSEAFGINELRSNINIYSSIGFYNNTSFELNYWYMGNKDSGPLILTGKNTIIKNINELYFEDPKNPDNSNVTAFKIIINDTDFQYDLQRKSIDFSTDTFNISNLTSTTLPMKTNFSWSSDTSIEVGIYYVISEKKCIYRKIGNSTGNIVKGNIAIRMTITSNFIANEDRFIFAITIAGKKYIKKVHIQDRKKVPIFYKDSWDEENIYKNANINTFYNFVEIEPGIYKCNETKCIENTELYDKLINNNFNVCNKCIVDEKGINIYTDELPSFGEWEFGDRCTIGTITYMYDGNKWNVISSIKGLTSERPSLQSTDEGFEYYDSTLKKKILWNGVAWVNIDGTELS